MVSLTKNDGILKSTEWSSTIYSIKLANWQNETTESSIRFPAFIEQFSCKLNYAYAHPRGHSWSFSLVIHDHWLETFESVLFACFLFQRPTDRMTSRPISESQDRLAGGPGTEPGTDSSLRRKKSDTRVRYPMIVPNDENSNGPSTNSEVLYLICIVFYAFLHRVRIFWDLFQKFRVHPR